MGLFPAGRKRDENVCDALDFWNFDLALNFSIFVLGKLLPQSLKQKVFCLSVMR
jgi:hypothetical protein